MKKKLKEFDVTIHYQCVTSNVVKAENEEEAKEIAMKNTIDYGIYSKKVSIEDDELKCCGVVNLSDSWGKLNN